MSKQTYTDAEKAAYYKAKYAAQCKEMKMCKQPSMRGSGPYKKNTANKGSAAYGKTKRPRRRTDIKGSGPYEVSGGLDFDWPSLGIKGGAKGRYYSGSGPYIRGKKSQFGDIPVDAGVPTVGNILMGEGTVVRFQEFLFDLLPGDGPGDEGSGTSALDINLFALNPGNSLLFPWVSQMAPLFQEYRITAMMIYFKSTCADYSANTSLGSVFMGIEYNNNSLDPTSKQQVEMLSGAKSCKPSETFLFPIECEKALNGNVHKYIVIDGQYPTTNYDRNLYDWGKVYIGTSGIPNPATGPAPIGEVWVTYEVVFYKPELSAQNGAGTFDGCHFNTNTGAKASPWFSLQRATPVDGVTTPYVSQGIQVASATTTNPGDSFLVTFPAKTVYWNYTVECNSNCSATDLGISNYSVTRGSNVAWLDCLESDNTGNICGVRAGTGEAIATFYVQVPPATTTQNNTLLVLFSYSSSATPTVHSDVIVTGFQSSEFNFL